MNPKQIQIETKKETNQQPDEFAQSYHPLEKLLESVRHVEGFPLGKDEDILALSDPPYYTACPNPYINDFIERYGKPYDPETDSYHREPFVSDVSEGKNDPIYNAHSYHTKVPHKAIMKFIEHYTEEGDIVFDGFCGSGMTGVAAGLLNRRAILCDLSPAATFIAYNYNTPVDVDEFEREAKRILAEVEEECGWMYETLHTDGKTKGRISYTVWSDVFTCPYCNNEYVFWDAAVEQEAGKVKGSYACPTCKAEITKRECERAWITFFDQAINQEVTHAKQVPVLINYAVGKKRFEKKPDQFDLDLLKKIRESVIPYWFPTDQLPDGYNTEQPKRSHGITHVHNFYTKRNLWTISSIAAKCEDKFKLHILGIVKSGLSYSTKMVKVNIPRLMKKGGLFALGAVGGTLYIPSISAERTILDAVKNKIRASLAVINKMGSLGKVLIFTNSTQGTIVAKSSVDYIFTDPPFGGNLMYSELNFLWEAWLKVFTNNRSEAIVNNTQRKGLTEYKDLMTACFKEMYRILKPNRWMTVVFHNSRASVWNAIQDAITRAGFIIAQVTVLDKQQGSFKQVTSSGAVKNDLVINAYKPRQHLDEHFLKRAGEGLEKDFVQDILEHLPVEPNIGRTEQMLFSKLLAHYVQRGYEIRLNARQFYTLLRDNFKLIDGYWFTGSQVLKYEEWKKKHGLKGIRPGQQIVVVGDEKSAIAWLYNFLDEPKEYSEIFTASRKIAAGVEDRVPELKELLDKNFIFENGCYRRPMTEKEKEAVEEQREKDLDKAFDAILNDARSGKKLKEVRKEAVIYGFTRAYQQKHYEDILTVAKHLDKKIIENNSEINDFIEIAKLKIN
jgi:DNA modification methylase